MPVRHSSQRSTGLPVSSVAGALRISGTSMRPRRSQLNPPIASLERADLANRRAGQALRLTSSCCEPFSGSLSVVRFAPHPDSNSNLPHSRQLETRSPKMLSEGTHGRTINI